MIQVIFFSNTFLEGNCMFFLIEFGIFFVLTCSSKSLNCIYLACMVLFEKRATCTNYKFNKKRCNAIPVLSSKCVNSDFLSEYYIRKNRWSRIIYCMLQHFTTKVH